MSAPGDEIPIPAHLQALPATLDMVPARNWWAVTPGYRGRLKEGVPPTHAEVGELKAELEEVKRAVLRLARVHARKGGGA